MPITVTTKSESEMYADKLAAASEPAPVKVEPKAEEKVEEPKQEPQEPVEPEIKATEDKPVEDKKPEEKPEEPKKPEDKKDHNTRRFEQLTKDLGFYRTKAEQLEAEMRQRRYPETQPEQAVKTSTTQGVPARDTFGSDEEWIAAISAYQAKQVFGEAAALQRREQEINTFRGQVDHAKAAYDDYDSVVQAALPHPVFSDPQYAHVTEAVRESELGPDLVYYLASNRDEADKVASMSPVSAVRYIGRIENYIEQALTGKTQAAKPETAVTKAPAPYQTPTGSGNAESGKKTIYDKNLTQAEFRKLWNQELSKK